MTGSELLNELAVDPGEKKVPKGTRVKLIRRIFRVRMTWDPTGKFWDFENPEGVSEYVQTEPEPLQK